MRITILLLTALLTANATAETRHAEAHVHGINHVQIILNGSTLQVTYEFPVAQLNEHKHDDEIKNQFLVKLSSRLGFGKHYTTPTLQIT